MDRPLNDTEKHGSQGFYEIETVRANGRVYFESK